MSKPTLSEFLVQVKARCEKLTNKLDTLVADLCFRAEEQDCDEKAEALWAIANQIEATGSVRLCTDVEALLKIVERLLKHSLPVTKHQSPNLCADLEALVPENK